ncbi:MAG: UDP-N-acetylmuramoyl-L-alanyl-D-glutamate--2,6-diaminopimelate ligase, partial [Candidatus Moraniibacteriota bacterium]
AMRSIAGRPARKIKIIGVTGTNGKTTTVQMITKILEESGAKVAMASTINFKLDKEEWVNATKFTTLSSIQVQKFITKAVKLGCEYFVLETSSHSLDQFRTWGIKYDTAVITNITREHLDYHKTMEGYRRAKLKLFNGVKRVVVNLDMEKSEEFLNSKAETIFGYTAKNQELIKEEQKIKIVKAEKIELGIDNSKYEVAGISYQINLPGLFNVENALAATCVGMAYGISEDVIKKALEKIQGVPGRMEKVPNSRGIEIIIDYALTPDSLEKLYELISKIKKADSKIISVFGSCGERDRGKRPIMGEIVSRYADYIIITNEDPYNENPNQIVDEVLGGIKNKKLGENLFRIMDRREAIKKALQLAKPGDIFVITGKGAEEVMAIGKRRIPWNEKKVILEELGKLN